MAAGFSVMLIQHVNAQHLYTAVLNLCLFNAIGISQKWSVDMLHDARVLMLGVCFFFYTKRKASE